MKKLPTILFFIFICFIPLGIVLRFQDKAGGVSLIFFGLLGVFIYFSAKTVNDIIRKRANYQMIIFQLVIVLMSFTIFTKYLYHRFGDYPSLIIIPIFIISAIIYFIKILNSYFLQKALDIFQKLVEN